MILGRTMWQDRITLPPAHSVSRLAYTSLLVDGSCYDRFKIMCLFLDEVVCGAGMRQES